MAMNTSNLDPTEFVQVLFDESADVVAGAEEDADEVDSDLADFEEPKAEWEDSEEGDETEEECVDAEDTELSGENPCAYNGNGSPRSQHQPSSSLNSISSRIVRSRGRGRRGCRGRGRGVGRVSHDGTGQGQSGHRIEEVYVNDDDVPDDLRDAVRAAVEQRDAQQRRAGRRRAARAVEGEEFVDEDDGGDAALFPGDENALRFEWRPMDSYQGRREKFLPDRTGPVVSTASAYAAFSQYWDEDILTHIVSETNRYALTLSFAKDWYDTNVHEIFVLFAFWMMLGIIKMPSTKSCFTDHPLLKTNCFRLMFSRKRYENLCSAMNFNNNCEQTSTSSGLFHLEPIVNHLNSRFQSAYIPRQEICIDESLTLWKGNLSFRQHIETKAAKYGIKTFELCESSTGYLWSFIVYTGRNSLLNHSYPASLLKSTAFVLQLMHPLLNKGYTLYMDDRFNSPLLARFLKRNHSDVVGTLRLSRSNVPALINLCQLREGELVARHSGDMTVLAYHNNKKVGLISTYHGSEISLAPPKPRRPAAWKPQLVLDYNKYMGGVDLKDGMLEAYELERKRCAGWNMKLFKRLLNCSILNSRICFEASTGARKDHLAFRLELVEQILKHHLHLVPKTRSQASLNSVTLPESRFTTNRHWPLLIMKRDVSGRTRRRKCKQCGKNTTFECGLCDVGLCANICFGEYHTPQ